LFLVGDPGLPVNGIKHAGFERPRL